MPRRHNPTSSSSSSYLLSTPSSTKFPEARGRQGGGCWHRCPIVAWAFNHAFIRSILTNYELCSIHHPLQKEASVTKENIKDSPWPRLSIRRTSHAQHAHLGAPTQACDIVSLNGLSFFTLFMWVFYFQFSFCKLGHYHTHLVPLISCCRKIQYYRIKPILQLSCSLNYFLKRPHSYVF